MKLNSILIFTLILPLNFASMALANEQKCSFRADPLDFQVRFSNQDREVKGRYSPHGVPEIVATFMEYLPRAKSAAQFNELVRYVLTQPASRRVLIDMRADVQWMEDNLKKNPNIKWIGTEVAPIPGQDFEQLMMANLKLLDDRMIQHSISITDRADMLMTLFGSAAYFYFSKNLGAKGIRLIPLEDVQISAKSDKINIDIYADIVKLKSGASEANIADIDRANMKLNQYLTQNSARADSVSEAELRKYLSEQGLSKPLIAPVASLGMKYRNLVIETKARDQKVIENILKKYKELGSGLFVFGLFHYQEQSRLLKKSACSR